MHSHHLHGFDQLDPRSAVLSSLSNVILPPGGADTMAPRFAGVLPEETSITDLGTILNLTSAASPFSSGLSGVNQTTNYTLVHVLLISFMALLGITLAYRWTHMLNTHLRHLFTMNREEDQRYWMYNRSRFWPAVKKNLLYAPLGKQRHNRELQLSSAIGMGTLPSRYHTLLLVLYLASNIAYMVILDFSKSNSSSVVAELRGRSGVLAAFNLIPTVLFALRNNPLIPLLRVSYDTFNLLHRWCARVVLIETLVHTVAWGVNAVQAGGRHQLYVSLSTSPSYAWGMVATSTFTLIVLLAASPVRHAFYETFLNVHRILVWLALVGVYVHLDKARLPQLPYVQLVMVFILAEWVWRSARIVYHNVSRRKGVTRVTIEALPAEACRVTFDLARPWHWQPGCHVHAYLPKFALWSSHPFSIAWAEERAKAAPLEIEMEKLPSGASPHFERPGLRARESAYSKRNSTYSKLTGAGITAVADSRAVPNMTLPRDASVTSISLIMRARSGMTRALYDRASASPSGTITTWGAIEGPYGGHESLSSYGTVVLFAGGVGITHCVGYVHHLMLQYAAGTCSTRKILLVWSVPNTEALEWVRAWMDRILKMEHRRDVLRVQLFVTKPRHREEVISNTGSVQMFPGRCNPSTILEKEMQERIGGVGVTVCGPGAFADGVRAAVRGVVTDGVVDFVEEGFTY